jgi:pimeloyl-ACP methyl ester carboxylesterase
MYDKWAYHHRDVFRADIWSWDMPGFGRTGTRGHFDAAAAYTSLAGLVAAIKSRQNKPLFLLGSSFGMFIATAGLAIEGIDGAAAQAGILVPGGPALTMMRALYSSPPMQAFLASPVGQACWVNTDEVNNADVNYGDPVIARHMKTDPERLLAMKLSGLATLANFEPAEPLLQNTKPFLLVVAEHDRMLGGIEQVKANFDAIGGPTRLLIKQGSDKHQLMLSETEWFSSQLDAWCRTCSGQ